MTTDKYNSEVSWFNAKTICGWVNEVVYEDSEDLIFRIETSKSEGYSAPMVKFNKTKQRIYFLTERAFVGDYPFPEFETKGYKASVSINGNKY